MVAAAALNSVPAEGSKQNHKNNQQQKKAPLPNAAPSLPSKPAFPKKVSNNWAAVAASKTPIASSSDNTNIQHQHSKSNPNNHNQLNTQEAKSNNKSHSHNYYAQSHHNQQHQHQQQQQQQQQLQRQSSRRGHNSSADQHKKQPRYSINDYNAAEVNNFLINRSRDLSQKSELHKQTGAISSKLKSRGADKDIVSIELSKLLSKKL